MTQEHFTARPPVTMPEITRERVRQFVESDSAYLRDAGDSGRNIRQLSLERQDQLNAFMATLSSSDLEHFAKLYTQEMQALTQTILGDAAKANVKATAVNVETAKRISQVGTWISLTVFFIVIISVIRR